MVGDNLLDLEQLVESAISDSGSFEKLLSDMDHDTAYELVSQYGGMRPALYALRNMSFKHKTPITGKAKSYIRSASKRFKDAWSSRAVPVRPSSGNPNIKFEFAQPVRTLDGEVKGRAHQFKGWSEEHKDFMYAVLHDGVKGGITTHPESTLKSPATTRVRTSSIKRLSESQLDLLVGNLLEGINYVDLLESMITGGNEKSDLVGANNAMNFSNPTRRKKRDWRSKRSMGDGTEKEGRTTRELRNRLARTYGSDTVKDQLEAAIRLDSANTLIKKKLLEKDSRLKKAGVAGYNKPKKTPKHPEKSHVVVAKDGSKVKTIRFGQQGVSGSPKKDGESESYKNRRKSFKARHAKNIKKGKMSAAYWADKVKW